MADALNPSSSGEKLFPTLQKGAPATPVSPSVERNEVDKNVFTELFGKDVSQKDGGVMNAVAAQQEKKSSFFGAKPKSNPLSLLKVQHVHSSQVGLGLLKTSILIFLITLVASLSQNSSRFSFLGANPALRAEQASEQVQQIQAEVWVQKHLSAALLLDQYSSRADEYIYNRRQSESAYTSENKRNVFAEEAERLQPEILALLEQIQNHLKGNLSDVEVQTAQAVLDELINELHARKGAVNEQTLLQDIQDLETARILLQSEAFKVTLNTADLEDLSDAMMEDVYMQFSQINASVHALISQIKTERVDWSVYLDAIEQITKSVDPLFNTEFSGNLALTDLRFNEDGSIIVTGETITADTKNFTLVSNLIDAYEESPYFDQAEDRSYAKFDSEDSYMGSFRISMKLEDASPSTNPEL